MLRLELWFSRSILWNAMLILFVPCNEIFVCWSLSQDHREHTGLVSRLSLPSTDIQLSQVQVQAIYHLIYAAAALLHINHCSRFTRESIRQKKYFFSSVCLLHIWPVIYFWLHRYWSISYHTPPDELYWPVAWVTVRMSNVTFNTL